MRILIESSVSRCEWAAALAVSPSRPRPPLLYSSLPAFKAAGHAVALLNNTPIGLAKGDELGFERTFRRSELSAALSSVDLALLWSSFGIRAIASQLLKYRFRRKVFLASYVWRVPDDSGLAAKRLAWATRLIARRAAGVVVMTREQALGARRELPSRLPVIEFTWGIDCDFYAQAGELADVADEHREIVARIIQKPYVILAGDQLRHDDNAIALAKSHGVRLVRVPQEAHTAARYRQAIAQEALLDRLFVVEKASYPTLRFLMQNSFAYVGLVDSSWQPAGWTVLSEALACGTPAVVYEGLVSREMQRLGGTGHFTVVPDRDLARMASWLHSQQSLPSSGSGAAARRSFARSALDLSLTGSRFVADLERALSFPGRP